jgi:hypothetical protein
LAIKALESPTNPVTKKAADMAAFNSKTIQSVRRSIAEGPLGGMSATCILLRGVSDRLF